MIARDTRIYLFDTTLRDGAQTQGVDFSVRDKAVIAAELDPSASTTSRPAGPAPTPPTTPSSPTCPGSPTPASPPSA